MANNSQDNTVARQRKKSSNENDLKSVKENEKDDGKKNRNK